MMLTGCVSHPQPTAHTPPANNHATADTTQTDVPFHERVDYARLPRGFDRHAEDFELVNVCTDDLVEHFRELGYPIEVYAQMMMRQFDQVSWSCLSFDNNGHTGDTTSILAEALDREEILATRADNFLRDADDTWLPGAYYLDYDIFLTMKNNCQIGVDSPRGRIAVTHKGALREGRVEEHCQLARETLEELYQDEKFLRAVYDDDIPFKDAGRG
ncbi:hypothetical protein C1Y63_03155 [Corynebacterium sp. 13CS0277]|uniref:hypothetical protein n=1 Tax=Corynebacterium sp. 13CS0277 TaxID=2071994 RepID=UPI000D03A261|nr:hypothetical protein [Corynebacterium sp. 13CS0277]PRQ12079.1 hypothetical protein C1Y63_03155 [Corynebacterium sp. 13CS0277]